MQIYDVYYDGPKSDINDIAVKIAKIWIAFALGKQDIAGHRVEHPTGRMASAIKVERKGTNIVAIVADEDVAPEAGILESGHPMIDLKNALIGGRAYPMHRGEEGIWGSAGYGKPYVGSPFAARSRSMWAKARSQGYTGVAVVPKEITAQNATSWIIPAMPAWSPAKHLADMIRNGATLR